jgi:hypothetical protein
VSSRDSETTNFNQRYEPPDQGLCAGNGFILEPVNSAYSIYTASGKVVRGPFNGGQLCAIAKNDLVDGASTAHFGHFANLSIGRSGAS